MTFAFRCCAISIVLITSMSWCSAQSTNSRIQFGDSGATRVRRIFLNIKGDEKLARRLFRFIDLELDDTGVSLVNTERDADLVISGEIDSEVADDNVTIGVTSIEYPDNGQTRKTEHCESMSTSDTSELFSGAAEGAMKLVREKFPNAHAIRFDPKGDTKASEKFDSELSAALKKFDFTQSVTAADVDVLIRLERLKVPIKTTLMKYELSASGRDGVQKWNLSGKELQSAKMAGAAPDVCPGRFADLGWMTMMNDPVYQTAKRITGSITRQNAALEKGSE